jgi:hypothetical protein
MEPPPQDRSKPVTVTVNTDIPLGRDPVDWEYSPKAEKLLLHLEGTLIDALFWSGLQSRAVDAILTDITETSTAKTLFGVALYDDRFDGDVLNIQYVSQLAEHIGDVLVGWNVLREDDIFIRRQYRDNRGEYWLIGFSLSPDWEDRLNTH